MWLGFAVMTAYIPGTIGGALPTGWVVLWLVMPLLLFDCNPELTFAHWWGAAFLGCAALSLLWSPHGLLAMMQWLALGMVFVWASSLDDLRPVLKGLAAGLGVSALVFVAQWLGWHGVQSVEGPAGLFVNPNLLAEASALMLILLVSFKLWPWLVVTVPGLATASRGALVALFVASMMWLWSQSRPAAVSVFVGILLVGVLIVKYPSPVSNRVVGAMTAESAPPAGVAGTLATARMETVSQRFDLWRDMLNGMTWTGQGVGSFEYLYPKFAQRVDVFKVRPQHAHNDLLELMFEFGVGALPLLLLMTALLGVNDVERTILASFLAIAMFGFPLHVPVTGFIAAMVAGRLARHVLVVWPERVIWRSVVLAGAAT